MRVTTLSAECNDMSVDSTEVHIAVLQTEVTNLKQSIKLQAAEYERRLGELNHAHQIATERNAEFVSREAFEQRDKELDNRIRELNHKIDLRNSEVDARLESRAKEIDNRLEARNKELDSRTESRNKDVDIRLRDGDRFRWISIGASGVAGGLIGTFVSRFLLK